MFCVHLKRICPLFWNALTGQTGLASRGQCLGPSLVTVKGMLRSALHFHRHCRGNCQLLPTLRVLLHAQGMPSHVSLGSGLLWHMSPHSALWLPLERQSLRLLLPHAATPCGGKQRRLASKQTGGRAVTSGRLSHTPPG